MFLQYDANVKLVVMQSACSMQQGPIFHKQIYQTGYKPVIDAIC